MLRKTLTLVCVLGGLATPAWADTTFKAGSLIIPTTSTMQHDCGAVAGYGLVYDVLRANKWLQANGYGAIKIYYAYKDTKTSPNRCTPTNLHVGATYTGSGVVTDSHPAWNDGCDFSVQSTTVTPVREVVNTTGDNSATDIDIVTLDTTGKTTVSPNWGSKTIVHTTNPGTNVHTVRYSGGPFIVADTQATNFLKLLNGTIIAQDSSGNNIDFSPFRQAIGTCTFGSTIGGYVRIHRAQVQFSAPTPKIFSVAPPRLGLLAENQAFATKSISKGILEQYLANSGLSFTGAFGCPPGGYNVGNATRCPIGDNRGQIFDFFDFADLQNGKLDDLDAFGDPLYKMFWAPHWQTYGTSGSDPTTAERTAIANLTTFLDGQAGLMAECHSIEAIEGAYDNGSVEERAYATSVTLKGQLQTCYKDAAGTDCHASTVTKWGVNVNPSNQLTSARQNCTDPTLSNGNECLYFSYPGDPFSQVGDYLWNPRIGSVRSFLPNTAQSSIYRPGVLTLISGVKSLDKTKLTDNTTARAMVVTDYASRNRKDNDPAKGNILYIAGHDLTGEVAGTKMIMQTLLLLGAPPIVYTTFEVSRASPIVAPILGQQAIVQGTVENAVPDYPISQMTTAIDAPNFRFPQELGHLRAYPLSGGGAITTTAVDFDSATSLFDVASFIPTPTYAGCGSNYTGGCRTIFTNLATGLRPPNVILNTSSNLAALGAVMAPSLTSTEHTMLIERTLAGIEDDASPGTYLPKLGGVDRSTVAIVPASVLSGVTRPTMIYFGSTDGMIHAACGSVLSGVCDQVGTELWAFMPRTQLPKVRLNSTRIDGSPRVVELFGDFYATGTRSFRTIMLFQTASGDPTVAGDTPAVYALDVTDPSDPKILWERTTPATRTALELGQGLVVAAGKVNIAGVNKLVAFAQTNNGGTGGAGMVVSAFDIELGTELWKSGYVYPAPRNGANPAVPASAIVGGAVAVDTGGTGLITDVVFGTIYGDIFQLDAETGTNKHGSNPLFRFSTDLKPFGAPLTLYSLSGILYALGVSGGYVDLLAAPQWTSSAQQAVGVSLTTPSGSAPLDEAVSAGIPVDSPYVQFVFDLNAGDKASAQAQVIGDQIYIITDSTDPNQGTYGTTAANTGTVYTMDVGSTTAVTTVVRGGAGSVASSGTAVYASSSDQAQRLGTDSSGNAGENVNTPGPRVSRRLWLRTL